MPTCVLSCESCGGQRGFFVQEDTLAQLKDRKSILRHCPACRANTNWVFAADERRSGEDRRQAPQATDGTAEAALDKRASPRFPPPGSAHVVYLEGSGAIRDLSLGGVFVVDSYPLPAGTPIELDLNLGEYLIRAKGLVRRSVQGEGMGIEFLDVPREGKRHLKLYLARLAVPGHGSPSR